MFATMPAAPPPASPQRAPRTVLVVDDDPIFLRMALRFLRAPGLTLLSAPGSAAALTLAAEHPGAIDLLVTDVVLPGLDGVALGARLAEARPGIKVIYMSGYTVEILAKYGAADGAGGFLGKPFTQAQLVELVQRVLEEAQP